MTELLPSALALVKTSALIKTFLIIVIKDYNSHDSHKGYTSHNDVILIRKTLLDPIL